MEAMLFEKKIYNIYSVSVIYKKRRAYIENFVLLFVGDIGGYGRVVGVGCLCLFCSCFFSPKKYNDVVNEDEASLTACGGP
jgi:hypothetical protein